MDTDVLKLAQAEAARLSSTASQAATMLTAFQAALAAAQEPPPRIRRRANNRCSDAIGAGRIVGWDPGGNFGRNKPCGCGSGRRAKRCCLPRKAQVVTRPVPSMLLGR